MNHITEYRWTKSCCVAKFLWQEILVVRRSLYIFNSRFHHISVSHHCKWSLWLSWTWFGSWMVLCALFGWLWLVLICYKRKILLTSWWLVLTGWWLVLIWCERKALLLVANRTKCWPDHCNPTHNTCPNPFHKKVQKWASSNWLSSGNNWQEKRHHTSHSLDDRKTKAAAVKKTRRSFIMWLLFAL